jgi:hypothetical protein
MDAFHRTYERGVAKLGLTKKKVKDKFKARASGSTTASRESVAGHSAHSASPSGYPGASTDQTTVERNASAISEGTASPSDVIQRSTSDSLRVECTGLEPLDTKISKPQSLTDATNSEQQPHTCNDVYLAKSIFLM